MKIGLDIDGVLSRHCDKMVDTLIARGKLPHGYTGSDWATWNPCETWHNLKWDDVKYVFCDADYWQDMLPFGGVAEFTQALKEQGHEIHIVTDRRWFSELEGITLEWLDKHGIAYDRLVILPGDEKARYCKSVGIERFIEDNYDNASAIADEVNISYLVERPYNYAETYPVNCLRMPMRCIVADLLGC